MTRSASKTRSVLKHKIDGTGDLVGQDRVAFEFAVFRGELLRVG
jgi:hypothetical protein